MKNFVDKKYSSVNFWQGTKIFANEIFLTEFSTDGISTDKVMYVFFDVLFCEKFFFIFFYAIL